MHEQNCFITLTYSTENLTIGGDGYTLYPRDLQLFMKRLRKKYGRDIKFFACGEYGDTYSRPHYHACLFGIDFADKVELNLNSSEKLYSSKALSDLWPFGFSTLGAVTFESAAYVARYVLKKKLGKEADYYEKKGIIPEFTRMSRKPGIGSTWLQKYQSDVYPHDYVVIRNGTKCRPPRYYGNQYELDNPEKYAIIKEARQNKALEMAHDNTKSRLKQKKEVKNQQIKTLLRKIE